MPPSSHIPPLLLLLLLLLLAAFTTAAPPSDDLYETLGVSSDASPIEIKRAYKKKALLHHPDKQTNASPQASKRAADRMQKIIQAYETLMDPAKRKMYDQYGTASEQEVQQRQRQQQQHYDPYDPWGFRQRHAIRSRTLKVSSDVFEDILQGNGGMWLLLLLSE
jgi:DnaJ-class molecular chaperone